MRAVLAALLLLAVAPASAVAAPGLEIGMEDERILLHDPARAPGVVEQWAAMGADVVRLHARWSVIAPAGRSRPSGFRAGDPGDRRYSWRALDRAVRLVRSAGMTVMLTITGPGPLWTSRAPRLGEATWKPRPRAFAAFSRAVARRYQGRVERYLVWNEPNIKGWLMPQYDCRRDPCRPVSPHLYRGLVRAAVPAIRRADPGAPVLIGELAPIGDRATSSKSTIPPLAFLRAMGCVDGAYRRLRGGPCAGFRAASADGFGHHPHGKRAAPDRPSRFPDWAKIADLRRLESVLDRLTRRGRLRVSGAGRAGDAAARGGGRGRFDIWLTEFGYQTSPPDHATGITVAHQASWLQEASYVAWTDPRVRSLTFYQWEDEPVRWRSAGSLAYAGWQSGLLYVDGEPKPALSSWTSPLVVARRRGDPTARVWGQVRPGGMHLATVERRGSRGWVPLVTATTGTDGAFLRRVAVSPGDRLRLTWDDEGSNRASPVLRVSRAGGLQASASAR